MKRYTDANSRNTGFKCSVWDCITKGTSALASAARYVIKNNPAASLVAGGAAFGILPIISNQYNKFIEDILHINVTTPANITVPNNTMNWTNSSDVGDSNGVVDAFYYITTINILLVSPIVMCHYLGKLTNYYNNIDNDNDGYTAKKIFTNYIIGASTFIPYAAWLLPKPSNYVIYTPLTAGLGIVSIKVVVDYFLAMKKNIDAIHGDYDSEQIPFFQEINPRKLAISTFCSVVPSALLGLTLFGIELHNGAIQNTNGFDKYKAWGTAYISPLVSSIFLLTHYITSILGEELDGRISGTDSNLNQIVVKTLCLVSMVGRGMCYTAIIEEFAKQVGASEEVALGVSIAFGGVIINAIDTIIKHKELEPIGPEIIYSEKNCKKISLAIFSVLEGAALAFPWIVEALAEIVHLDNIPEYGVITLESTVFPVFCAVEVAYWSKICHKAFSDHKTRVEGELKSLLNNDPVDYYATLLLGESSSEDVIDDYPNS